MKRESYLNLNGFWDYAIMGTKRIPDRFDGKILVPFSPEAPLSGVERQLRPRQVLWYKRILPREVRKENGKRWLLHFGAVDQFAAVYINKILVTKHLGGYLPFTADVTDALKEGENELLVAVRDFTDHSYYSQGKQKLAKGGMFYTAQSGIWQTVWMEFTPAAHICSVQYYPNVAEGSVTIKAVVEGEGIFSAAASYEGTACGSASARTDSGNVIVTIPLSEIHLWEAGAGRLYDLQLSFGDDKVSSYFGLREVKLDGYRFLINGKSVFQRLILDQGFYPASHHAYHHTSYPALTPAYYSTSYFTSLFPSAAAASHSILIPQAVLFCSLTVNLPHPAVLFVLIFFYSESIRTGSFIYRLREELIVRIFYRNLFSVFIFRNIFYGIYFSFRRMGMQISICTFPPKYQP